MEIGVETQSCISLTGLRSRSLSCPISTKQAGTMERKASWRQYPVAASDYILLEEVGQGASATVYRAKCIRLNEIVAIKVLDLEKCYSDLDEVRREAQTMRLINHPNVLSAHCSFVVEQSLWVVMPYMAGGSCLHIMKSAYSDGFEEPVIATILRECLKALEYLHSHGHIHRDVKAGNILVDSNGAVKLGDFGVSACMFDTGDRQHSRNTFVGTPCWMAPEVMEQLHGYGFKADIWSFGITALELAHGHAPFSKYPPMKVLLMTLQNAPPGLDYERDKRFTKAFKEMIAVCLVKDPMKRPTAEKLLRHAFFKRARSYEYIARTILDGLPPLGQRLRDLKLKDEDRLAQKKMPFSEKEERSQNEYKRGVSAWNFDVEDLRAQAALIQDDDASLVGKEDVEQLKPRCSSEESENLVDSPCQEPAPLLQTPDKCGGDDFQSTATIHSLMAESTTNAGEHITRVRSGPMPAPIHQNSADDLKEDRDSSVPHMADNCNIPQHSVVVVGTNHLGRGGKEEARKDERFLKKVEERDLRAERLPREVRRASSGPLLSDYVLSSYRGRDAESDRDRPATRGNGDIFRAYAHYRERTFSGPLTLEGNRERLEKGLYVQRGRFSVTSEDVDLLEGGSRAPRKSASTQALSQLLRPPVSTCSTSSSSVVIHSYLHNILQHTVTQQELISNLIDSIRQGGTSDAHCMFHPGSKVSCRRTSSIGGGDSLVEAPSEREHELLQQVADLQSRVTNLLDELQVTKLQNVSLERKLNAIYNKDEEERIMREKAAEGNS